MSISVDNITSKIFIIRGEKVMLDRDLAELYDVQTKTLKQAVRYCAVSSVRKDY